MSAPTPTRYQVLNVVDDMQRFARALRGLGIMIESGQDPETRDPEFVAALRTVASRMDTMAFNLAEVNPEEDPIPGSTTLPEMAALLLATLWSHGSAGFKSSVDLLVKSKELADAMKKAEGKS